MRREHTFHCICQCVRICECVRAYQDDSAIVPRHGHDGQAPAFRMSNPRGGASRTQRGRVLASVQRSLATPSGQAAGLTSHSDSRMVALAS